MTLNRRKESEMLDDWAIEFATLIHYPEHWDTAAYPTLASAIIESLAWARCSACKNTAELKARIYKRVVASIMSAKTKVGRSPALLDPLVGLDARSEVGKWLNEQTNRDVDREALAELCAEYDRIFDGIGRCWPWSHTYTAWTDTHNVTKSRTFDNSVVAHGVLQERRCTRCGKLQLRTAWAW